MQMKSAASGYTLAGDQISSFERIIVAPGVSLPGSAPEEADERSSFKAETQEKRKGFSLRMPWFILLMVAAIVIMSMTAFQRMATQQRLHEELLLLSDKYTASEEERQSLEAAFLAACDSSFISYYAAQNLGMKRALQEQTIQIQAASTRPQLSYAAASIGGLVSGNAAPVQ